MLIPIIACTGSSQDYFIFCWRKFQWHRFTKMHVFDIWVYWYTETASLKTPPPACSFWKLVFNLRCLLFSRSLAQPTVKKTLPLQFSSHMLFLLSARELKYKQQRALLIIQVQMDRLTPFEILCNVITCV